METYIEGDVKNGVNEDISFLAIFLRNLLMGEQNELKNRYMHIRWDKTTHSTEKQHIGSESSILELLDTKEISSRMKGNIMKLHEAFGAGKGKYRFIV